MSAVDERVVRMEFDNKQFEQNIKQSIKSLDDLDKQLGLVGEDDAFDNIDKSSKRIDFSHLLSGVGKISDGFSALEVIAIGALTRIGSKITDVISQYAGQLTFKQIGAGWNKYTQMMEATQTTISATAESWEKEADALAKIEYLTNKIGDKKEAKALYDLFSQYESGATTIDKLAKKIKQPGEDIKKVKKELQGTFDEISKIQNTLSQEEFVDKAIRKINWYADETSYNYTDMVSTMGKMTGSGSKLMESGDAITGMMNMVAVAGGNAATGVRIAYNAAQAFGAGKLTMLDWKSFQNMNVATVGFKNQLLEAAADIGILVKVTDEGEKSLYRYSDAFKKGDKTIFGATKGFEATLATGWATAEVQQKAYEAYGEFTNELYDFVETFHTNAADALTEIDEFYKALDDEEAMKAWNQKMVETFGEGEEAQKAIESYEKSLERLGSEELRFSREAFLAAQQSKTFKDVMDAMADTVSTKWMQLFQGLFGGLSEAKLFWGDFYDFLYDIFASPVDNILKIQEEWASLAPIMSDGTVLKGPEMFRQSLINLEQAILAIINPIREAFNLVFFEKLGTKLFMVTRNFKDFTESLIIGDIGAEKIKNTFTGLFKVVKGITGIFGSAFKIIKPIFRLVGPIANLIATLASKIGLLMSEFADIANSNAGSIVDGIARAVSSAVDWISEKLDALTDWINKNVDFDGLVTVFGTVKKAFVTAWNAISASAQTAWEYIAQYLPTFEEISAFFESMWQTIQGFLPTWEEVVTALQEGWQWFSNIATTIWNFVKPYVDQLGEALGKFWGRISKFVEGFAQADDKMQYLKDNVLGIVDAFLEWKRNSKFIKWVVQQFENVKKVVQDIKEALKPKDGQSDAGSFFGIMYLVASITALFVIMRNVGKISTGFKNLTQAVKRFSTSIKRIVTFVGIYLVIKAITDLIQALQSFAQLDTNQIGAAMLFVIGMLGSLILFAFLMNKFVTSTMSEGDIKNFRKVTVTLAIVLLAIAGAFWILSKSNATSLDQCLMLVIMLTAICLAAYALSTYVGDVKTNTIITLVALAAVLLVAALAIEKIAKLDAAQFEQARNIILILAGVALAAMVVGAILNKGSDTMKNIAIAVGVMAASLLIIVIALNKLQTIKMNIGMVGMLIGVLAVLAILAVIPVYMAKFARERMITGKDMTKMASTIGIMAISLLAIVLALGFLAKTMSKAGLSSGDMLALSGVVLAIGITLGVMALALAGATAILGKSESKLNDMKKTAKAVRSMVVSLLLIVAALAVMTKLKMTVESTTEAMNIIWNVIIMLVVLTFALAGASKLAGKRGLKSGPIIAMVLGIIALVGTLMVLTKFIQKNGNDIGKAAIIMGAIMVVFGVMALLVGGATALAGEKGLQWGAIAVMMLGIMGIAHMMILMSVIPSKQLKTIGFVLGGIIVAIGLLAIAMGILQKNSDSWGNTARAAIMMIVAIGAVIALVYALKQLEDADVSWKTLGQLGAMAVGLLVFAGVLVLLSGLATGGAIGILVISVLLIAIAGAMVLLSVAALIASEALPKFVEGIKQLIDVISAMDVSGKQFWTFVGILVAAAILGTIAMIGIGAGALIMAAGFFIGALALSIVAGILPQLAQGLVILVTTLVVLSQYADVAASTAWKLAEAFFALMLAGIAIGIGLAVAGVGLGVVSLAAMGLATAILIASLGVSTFVASLALLAQGVALVADIFKGGNLSEQVSGFAESVKSGTSEITESVNNLQTTMNGAGGGGEGGGLLAGLFGTGEGGPPDFISMLGLSGEGGLKDQLTGFLSGEGGLGDFDLMSMIGGEDGLFGGMDFGGDLTNVLSGGIEGIDTSKLSGMFSGKLDGMFNLEDMDLGGSLMSSITSGIESTDLGPSGEQAADSFIGGVDSKKGAAKSSGKSLSQSGSSGASSANGGWVSAGSNGAQGLVNGIRSKLSSAQGAGRELAEAAYQAAMKYLQEKSPSRLFMQTGEYVSEGFAIGITSGIPMAVSSVKDMAMSTVGAASEILANAIDNDYANPVIRPTLDLSNVAAGAAGISSMFGNQTVGVNGQYTNGTAPTGNTVYNYTQNNYSPKALNRMEIYRQTKNQINSTNVLASV